MKKILNLAILQMRVQKNRAKLSLRKIRKATKRLKKRSKKKNRK